MYYYFLLKVLYPQKTISYFEFKYAFPSIEKIDIEVKLNCIK